MRELLQGEPEFAPGCRTTLTAAAVIQRLRGELWAVESMLADLKEEKNVLLLKPSGPCQHDGCDRSATDYAQGRDDGHRPVNAYCETHAKAVADEGSPEYAECCPCCGCRFGVN